MRKHAKLREYPDLFAFYLRLSSSSDTTMMHRQEMTGRLKIVDVQLFPVAMHPNA